MPVVIIPSLSPQEGKSEVCAAGHVDHIAEKGPPTAEFMGLIHTPIAIRDAMKIEEAAATINKEWEELSKIAWDVNKVRSRQYVIKESKRDQCPVHFGSMMDLCHKKHAELPPEFWRYKGRVVLKGETSLKMKIMPLRSLRSKAHLRLPWQHQNS